MPWNKLVAKTSHASFRFLKALTDFLDSFFSGFWLGVMGQKSLAFSDELFYSATKYYTDDDYNLKGLFDWEKPFITKHFSDAGNILLIAAGGGREVLALSRMGYEVEGYECNFAYLNYGNSLLAKNNVDTRIRYLRRNTVPEETKKYDGIIIGWGAYSHITGSETRIKFLSDLTPFLHDHSRIMISFVWCTGRTRKDKVIKTVSRLFGIFNKGYRFESGDRLIPDYIHYFTKDEIENELSQAKYRILDYYSHEYGCAIACI